MAATRSVLTFNEFEQLPDRPGKTELLEGELIELPPAKRKHQEIAHRLYEQLKTFRPVTETGSAVFLEMGYQLRSDTWLQPDVGITQPQQEGDDYFQGSPLLAVEVVSESNRAIDINGKVER